MTSRGTRTAAHTVRVPWTMSSVVAVRRSLVSQLQALEVDSLLVDEAAIVVSELVANAVRHAKALPDGTIQVDWGVTDGVVELSVTDGRGLNTPRPAPYSLLAAHGRGLRIVRSLAHEWGVQDDGDVNTVWVSLGGPSRRQQGISLTPEVGSSAH